MSKDRRWLKVVVWIAGILVALILIGTLTLKLIFTKQRIISMLLPIIESNINRKVEIKDADLSIWKGLGLDIKGVTIYSPPEFSQKQLAQFEAISLKVKPLPLLKRRIELTGGILVKPRIIIEKREVIQKNERGVHTKQVTNWDGLVRGGPALAFPVIFGQMEIKDGSLLYSVPSEQKQISLSGIDQKIKFVISQDRNDKGGAKGEISIGHIELSLPDYKGQFPAIPLSLKHDLKIDLEQERLEVDRFDLSLGEIKIIIQGGVEKITSAPYLNLKVSSKDIPLEKITEYLTSAGKQLPGLQVTGQGNLSLNLKGQIRRVPLPQIDGKISFKKVNLSYAKSPFPLNIPYAEILVNSRNLSFSTNDASLGSIPLDLKGVIDNFLSPNFNLQVKSDFDTKILQKFEQFPKDIKIDGRVRLDLRAYGKLENPKGARISGSADLEKMNLESPNLTVPIKDLNAALAIRDYDLDIQQIKCNLGQSDLDFKGKVSDVVPRILSPKEYNGKPRLDFTLYSSLLNLDEILPTADTSKSSKQPKISKKPPLPIMDMDVQGKLTAGKIIFRKINLTDFVADISFLDRILRIENISSRVYQGTIDGTAQYDLTRPENPQFDLIFDAKGIETNDFASDFLGNQLLQSLGGRIYGKLNLISHFKGQGTDVDDIKKSLWAEGGGGLADGKIEYGEFISALARSLNLDIPKEDDIKTLTNSFRISNERVYFDDYELAGTKANWNITGSIGFDKTLDYLVVLSLPLEVARQYVKSGDLLRLLEDKKGRVVIPLKVGGTIDSPHYSLDASQSEKKLKEDLKQKAKTQGEELLKKIFKR